MLFNESQNHEQYPRTHFQLFYFNITCCALNAIVHVAADIDDTGA